jgi:membrane-bound lytic murein transglycosylase D
VTANDRYDSLFRWYASGYNIDWLLLKAQVKAESSFMPYAQSPAGARGLAQFMTATFDECAYAVGIGTEYKLRFNPEQSIQCQAYYMSRLILRFGRDNVTMALAAYNWGQGNVAKIQGDLNWMDKLPLETQQYIVRVSQYHQEYIEAENSANV